VVQGDAALAVENAAEARLLAQFQPRFPRRSVVGVIRVTQDEEVKGVTLACPLGDSCITQFLETPAHVFVEDWHDDRRRGQLLHPVARQGVVDADTVTASPEQQNPSLPW
jgi:hypothetical protein